MSEASASGSAGSGGLVLFSSDTRAAFVAKAMSRASRYRPCDFVRLVSLEVTTTARSQNSLSR